MRHRRLHRYGSAALAAMTAIGLVAAPVAATDGWLDPTFSGDGWVRLPQGTGGAAAVAVVAGPTGGAIVARLGNRAGVPTLETLALTAAGGVSSSFHGGTWRRLMAGEDKTVISGLAATPSGGAVASLGPIRRSVLRIREVGPDGLFLDGVAIGQHDDLLNANVVRLPGGSTRTCSSEWPPAEPRLIGTTPDYQFDFTLGEDRVLPIDDCLALGADAAGHLYMGGTATAESGESARIDLLRTTTSGIVDTAWNGDGFTSIGLDGFDVALPREVPQGVKQFSLAASPILPLPDGSVYIVARVNRIGSNLRSAAIIKLTPDGELDPSFDGDGLRSFAPSGGQSHILAMAVDAEGRPVVSFVKRFADGRIRGFLARMTTTGAFDPSFGRSGEIQQSVAADELFIDAQGRIVTVARAGSDPQDAVIVARRNG